MTTSYCKWFCFIFVFMLWIGGSEVNAHDGSYGYSKWYVHDKSVEAIIVIDQLSIAELAPAGESTNKNVTNEELTPMYSEYIQSYLTDKLKVYADRKELPFQVTSIKKINSNEIQMNLSYTSKWTIEQLKIEYQLFFQASNNKHKNLAYIYPTNSENKPTEHIFNSNNPIWEGNITVPVPFFHNLGQFVALGIEHILTGYDHILFLISLLLMINSLREVIVVTTSFTIAHSVTLTATGRTAYKISK